MIAYFKKRALRKRLKEYLHAARHARHMREDIANSKDIERLLACEAEVRAIRLAGEGDWQPAVERLVAAADKVYPSSNTSGVRENVEVVIVALAAAMAIRAFFFQPYKIPTGSMQPTLNGIISQPQDGPGITDHQPLKFVKWLLTGESYKEIYAQAAGTIDNNYSNDGDNYTFWIGGVPHKIPEYMLERGQPIDASHFYNPGDVIVSRRVIAGDHILVNKMAYNFRRPRRGDIAVFDTRHINHPQVRRDSFYIKRMVGMPGERIQIQNNHIVADGKIVDDPPIFKKIDTDPAYHGHVNAGMLDTPDKVFKVPENQYLMMGDNTLNSLDGRFFGGVPRDDFQGPAMFVYWPFRLHWGTVQ